MKGAKQRVQELEKEVKDLHRRLNEEGAKNERLAGELNKARVAVEESKRLAAE
jgi:phosphohistidine phosphatase SixA